jgi:hypothetical protein
MAKARLLQGPPRRQNKLCMVSNEVPSPITLARASGTGDRVAGLDRGPMDSLAGPDIGKGGLQLIAIIALKWQA